uniref:Uncharacterized protein n=1 Tax=Rhizophora mucronata TaxID=61149 RepID=A0A2P2MV10_RHIMU
MECYDFGVCRLWGYGFSCKIV